MTATLWLDSEKEITVELGGTIEFLKAFKEFSDVAGSWEEFEEAYPNLSGIADQVLRQDDADSSWYEDVRKEARDYLGKYGTELSLDSVDVLNALVAGPDGGSSYGSSRHGVSEVVQKGGTCKPGQRSDLTGCTPAEGNIQSGKAIEIGVSGSGQRGGRHATREDINTYRMVQDIVDKHNEVHGKTVFTMHRPDSGFLGSKEYGRVEGKVLDVFSRTGWPAYVAYNLRAGGQASIYFRGSHRANIYSEGGKTYLDAGFANRRRRVEIPDGADDGLIQEVVHRVTGVRPKARPENKLS